MTFDELLSFLWCNNRLRVCIDSRNVRSGDGFVAIKGNTQDGHSFIEEVIDAGARVVVCQRDCVKAATYNRNCQFVFVDDSSWAAGLLAQAWKGNPASKLTNLAVTGTNGKSTVAFLVRSCLQSAGYKCGLVGTVIYDMCSESHRATLTTPDQVFFAEAQERMVASGARFMIAEASSHALSQNRLAGIDFAAAAFTNLTRDHLDYHQSNQAYLDAKTRLFSTLSADGIAVLNRQSPISQQIAGKTTAGILWYAVEEDCDLKAEIESLDEAGSTFVLEYAGLRQRVRTALLGRYNISNCLAAAGLCLVAGLQLPQIAEGVSALRVVPGRLEKVEGASDFTVLVDYAHTDDALENVLSTLKAFCRGSLIVVFGCGGDRDRGKRPRMAEVTKRWADFVVVTSDNPRTEEPAEIIRQIMVGFAGSVQNVCVEPDREKAIEFAVAKAHSGDIVLIAGKGHETEQILSDRKIHFDDRLVAQQCLKKRR